MGKIKGRCGTHTGGAASYSSIPYPALIGVISDDGLSTEFPSPFGKH